jgi:hypothetical protein
VQISKPDGLRKVMLEEKKKVNVTINRKLLFVVVNKTLLNSICANARNGESHSFVSINRYGNELSIFEDAARSRS